ncbi:MAG: Nucleotidyltransferase [Candidatus Ozemobacter sibiricus]|uniref:Nucleotidyltransferase n=1 Tax=Candidatus Ozemobacter sibiricus TaxID=2268124 RepID=A0A367ZPU3_9BACT|nr:MAG: Nucleotidyltransferase [Candidatus Ozemobacter sibiricus]
MAATKGTHRTAPRLPRRPPDRRDVLIERLRRALPDLQRRYPIKTLGLFGSWARNDAAPESDVDLLVELARPIGLQFVTLADELEKILQTRVDLVSRGGVKPPYLKEILKDLIYVAAV